jgi:phosphatidylglycerol:prolipoprotein diacylglycerol transferase
LIPILFRRGDLPIRSYGLMMAVAFLVGIWLARRRARAANLNPDIIIDLALVVIIASIAGARAAYVAVHWDFYRLEPASIVRIWDGGLTQYGGLSAGIIAGLLFFRLRGVDPWRGADIVAPSLAAGVAVGRLGCFLNGCCFGLPCDLPWAVTFGPQSAAGAQFPHLALHPTQIYESLAAACVLLILLIADRRKPFDGFLLWFFVMLLSAYRFAVDPLRYYESMSMVVERGGLAVSSNQLMGIVLISVSLVFMAFLRRRSPRPAGH